MIENGITLNAEQTALLVEMDQGKDHLFISGRAGTGKSTLLQYFVNYTSKSVAVVAPTGIAAVNVRGQTIHSFFKFPPRLLLPSSIRGSNSKVIKQLEILIIDEISMVRADLMDAIDIALRKSRRNYRPFGGVKVIMFGDLYQLPPVVQDGPEKEYLEQTYDSPYFFSANVWFEARMPHLRQLEHIHRQTDTEFIRLLNSLRDRSFDKEDLAKINSRHLSAGPDQQFYITLTSTNALARAINMKSLNQLNQPVHSYQAVVKDDFDHRLFPTNEILSLKVGAQVMCIKNDMEGRYVNGTIGIVRELTPDRILVEVEMYGKKEIVDIEETEWERISYTIEETEGIPKIKAKVIGKFQQYPLKLAWATTIHKSQGKTYEKCVIDLGYGAFAHGQTYVALSRCRTLDGIILKRKLRPEDIIIDDRVADFYRDAEKWS